MSTFETLHFINGQQIRPVNADDIGIKLDWTGDAKEAELTVDSIQLANDGKLLVEQHISQFGFFEGIPYTVQIGTVILDYYIDLTETPRISGEGDFEIEVTIKRRKAVDWFKQQADGLSFEALNQTYPITTIDVPYIIVRDNQLEMLIMLAISAYTLTKALIEGIQDLTTAITELIAAATPNAGVPPSFNTGAIIGAALKVVARLIYVAAIIVALIDLTKQIIELIFPPVRKLKASRVKHLIERGCEKLGYEFSSTILNDYSSLTILGVPLKKPGSESLFDIFTNLFSWDNGSFTKGYPTARDTVPTLGSLIDAMQEMFNAKIRIVGNKVFLERRDYWALNSGVQINRTLNLQDQRENQRMYNAGDWWKRYYLHFRYDLADTQTMNAMAGTDTEYSTEPVSVQNADLSLIKGLVDIDLPFSYGIRKKDLTFVEEAALPVAQAADEVVQFFGGESDLEAQVSGRIGILQISQQYYTVTKLMYCANNGRQPENYLSIIGANPIYTKFHAINQVKENFKRIQNETVNFSTNMFEMLIDNNYVTDQNGNSLEIRTFEWVNEGKQAEIEYAEFSDEGFNTKTILIDG